MPPHMDIIIIYGFQSSIFQVVHIPFVTCKFASHKLGDMIEEAQEDICYLNASLQEHKMLQIEMTWQRKRDADCFTSHDRRSLEIQSMTLLCRTSYKPSPTRKKKKVEIT